MKLHNHIFSFGFLCLMFLALTGCSNNPETAQEQTTTNSSSATQSATEPFLVFFLDPNGGPCRMQDQILAGMSDELKGQVNLYYVRTTIPDDMKIFYAYGIRALPTLLLADASGKEIKRLPPGIRSAEEIRSLLKVLPAG